MSKFDPPASRFDPPASRFDLPASAPPPPVHHLNVEINPGNEIPPMHQNVSNPGNQMGNPNAPATVQRCNNANLMRVVALGLRGLSLVFSFLSFVIIATINGFNTSDHYNYVFAVALISFIYNAVQNAKGVFAFVTRKELISQDNKLSALIDFIGDQVITYMLMSGSSVGLAIANDARQTVNLVGDSALDSALNQIAGKTEGGASMLFFAFLALVFPTIFSGHKLSQAFTACSN